MSAKNSALWISLLGIALFAGLSVTRAQSGDQPDVVTAISNLENDAALRTPPRRRCFLALSLAKAWAVAPSQIHNGRLRQGVRDVPQSNFRSLLVPIIDQGCSIQFLAGGF